jgi:hypothetical protein
VAQVIEAVTAVRYHLGHVWKLGIAEKALDNARFMILGRIFQFCAMIILLACNIQNANSLGFDLDFSQLSTFYA